MVPTLSEAEMEELSVQRKKKMAFEDLDRYRTGRGIGVSGKKFFSYYHMDGACTAANPWAFHPTKSLSDTRGTTALPNCTTEIRSH